VLDALDESIESITYDRVGFLSGMMYLVYQILNQMGVKSRLGGIEFWDAARPMQSFEKGGIDDMIVSLHCC
jgi:hypothetical protein